MNKTDYRSLDITEEEIGAVRRYISNAHISMNALLDIDPDVINAQQSKGWLIDFSREGIEKNTEYLTKLYAAMYKYSLQTRAGRTTVYRGTSRDEVDKLKREGMSGRFLSTTTDRDIAMRFTEYRNGALFAMSLNDVPYIHMDEFLDETQVSESEILVSPFSKVEGIESYSYQDIEGVTRYSANVKKQEFTNITEEERKKYQETIESFNFEESLARYKDLSFKAELMGERVASLRGAKTKDEREELAYMIDRQSELFDELTELKMAFGEVKKSMTAILEDKFRTVELEIEKGLEQDKIAIEDEERKRKVELERGRKEDLLKRADRTLSRVSNAEADYSDPDAEEQELYKEAEELGVDTDKLSKVDSAVITKFEELKKNIEEIKREIAAIELPDNLSKEDMAVSGELNQKLNALYDKLSMTNKVMDECEKTIYTTKEKNKAMLSRGVATRLGEDITAKAKQDLLTEEQALKAKKDSLWDKLTGKSKIKAAQIENLRLRREYIERGGLSVPKTMEEMSSYAAKYKEVLGEERLPDSLRKIMPSQRGDVIVTYEEREVIEAARPGTALIPLNGSKKQILAALEGQNTMLKTRIQGVRLEGGNTLDGLETEVKNSVERCLDTAIFYTSELTEEQKKQIMVDQITL